MIMKPLTYKTADGSVVCETTAHPHAMPWVGQRPAISIPEWLRGPLVVEKVYGDQNGYVAVVGAL